MYLNSAQQREEVYKLRKQMGFILELADLGQMPSLPEYLLDDIADLQWRLHQWAMQHGEY